MFFLHLLRWSLFFFFKSVNMVNPLNDFQMSFPLWIPGINSTSWWHVIIFVYHCIQFAKILLRIFAATFMTISVCSFLLFIMSSSGFGIRAMLDSHYELGSTSSSSILYNWYYLFLKCLEEFTVKPSGIGVFFGRRYFYYKFNFFNRYRVIHIFILSELWQPVSFKEVVHFI